MIILTTKKRKRDHMKREYIKEQIRTIPDFPKKGIMFRDITTLIGDAKGLRYVIEEFVDRYKDMSIDSVAGIESRGFIIAGAIAKELGVGFVPIRKPGKLPYKTASYEYELEYGKDKVEIHIDAVKENEKVLIVDDLLATGGTMRAAAKLIETLSGVVVECAFIVTLRGLGGKEKLKGYKTFHLVEFEGE